MIWIMGCCFVGHKIVLENSKKRTKEPKNQRTLHIFMIEAGTFHSTQSSSRLHLSVGTLFIKCKRKKQKNYSRCKHIVSALQSGKVILYITKMYD